MTESELLAKIKETEKALQEARKDADIEQVNYLEGVLFQLQLGYGNMLRNGTQVF